MTGWTPTRSSGLARLAAFVPDAGSAYARGRNTDEGWDSREDAGPQQRSGVSGLSPWIQRRLVLESEVVRAVLRVHSASAAEKFLQEVLWRTYWKGWLQHRPSVWDAYTEACDADARLVQSNGKLARLHQRAVESRTGITCFDHWSRELQATGYLHNHARMWFASIWTFTLGLPWTLGAALFEQHLLDADAASNTLSWRWVVGLHTRGKHYVARAENIEKFTQGRYDPKGQLVHNPGPLHEDDPHPLEPLPDFEEVEPGPRSGLLLTPEDLTPERSGLRKLSFAAAAGGLPASMTEFRAPLAGRFDAEALDDGLRRTASALQCPAERLVDGTGYTQAVVRWAQTHALERVVAMAPHVGPYGDAFEAVAAALRSHGITVGLHRRAWDRRFFPHATSGYFKFKRELQKLVRDL